MKVSSFEIQKFVFELATKVSDTSKVWMNLNNYNIFNIDIMEGFEYRSI